MGYGTAVGRRALEGAAKGAEERPQLGDGGQGALGEEGELQRLRGGFLTQPVQCLEDQDVTVTYMNETCGLCMFILRAY